MDVLIDPDPPEADRKAIVAALTKVEQTPPASAWWRAGIEDAVAADDV